jgi:hypothetical protein
MRNLPLLTYIVIIIIGGLMIVLPDGIHFCIACGSVVQIIAGIVGVVLGIAGLATRGQMAIA